MLPATTPGGTSGGKGKKNPKSETNSKEESRNIRRGRKIKTQQATVAVFHLWYWDLIFLLFIFLLSSFELVSDFGFLFQWMGLQAGRLASAAPAFGRNLGARNGIEAVPGSGPAGGSLAIVLAGGAERLIHLMHRFRKVGHFAKNGIPQGNRARDNPEHQGGHEEEPLRHDQPSLVICPQSNQESMHGAPSSMFETGRNKGGGW
jgi:hypothetical protein